MLTFSGSSRDILLELMELNDSTLTALAGYLQQTLSPDPSIRKPAEDFIRGVESQKNFGLALLHLIGKENCDPNVQIAGAIAFKNFIKRNWKISVSVMYIMVLVDMLISSKIIFCLTNFENDTIRDRYDFFAGLWVQTLHQNWITLV